VLSGCNCSPTHSLPPAIGLLRILKRLRTKSVSSSWLAERVTYKASYSSKMRIALFPPTAANVKTACASCY